MSKKRVPKAEVAARFEKEIGYKPSARMTVAKMQAALARSEALIISTRQTDVRVDRIKDAWVRVTDHPKPPAPVEPSVARLPLPTPTPTTAPSTSLAKAGSFARAHIGTGMVAAGVLGSGIRGYKDAKDRGASETRARFEGFAAATEAEAVTLGVNFAGLHSSAAGRPWCAAALRP